MLDAFLADQCAARFQDLEHVVVGVQHVFAGEELGAGHEAAVVTDGIVDFQAVALADDKVFLPMTRRGMHGAGSGFQRDVLAEDDRHLTRIERVLQRRTFQG